MSAPAAVARRIATVRPAPRREPPFDDEPAARQLRSIGPFDQQLPFEVAPRPVFTLPAHVPGDPDLPDPGRWGRRLLTAIVETATGHRPLPQLTALLSPSVARGLGAEFERAAQRRQRHWICAATVRSMRASQPAEGVAELCATVQIGQRFRAVALRLEAHEGRWYCTRLQLG